MSDYDRNVRDPRLTDPAVGDPVLEGAEPAYDGRSLANSPGSWFGGIIVAILVILGIAYVFGGIGNHNGASVERRAAATDTTAAPPATAAKPAPAPSTPSK